MVFKNKRQGFTTLESTPPVVEIPGFKEPVPITSVGQVDELLEAMCLNQPQDKRCGAYKTWKLAYNALVYTGNRLAGFQRIKSIK